jgi:predicted secreted protein
MAALMGKDGLISIGANTIGYIDSWSLTAGLGSAEITQYGDPMRNYQTTIKEWSGSLSGTLSLSDAQQISLLQQASTAALASVSLKFVTAVGSWAGSAYVKGYTVNSKVSDKVSVSFPFQGTGALAYTSS